MVGTNQEVEGQEARSQKCSSQLNVPFKQCTCEAPFYLFCKLIVHIGTTKRVRQWVFGRFFLPLNSRLVLSDIYGHSPVKLCKSMVARACMSMDQLSGGWMLIGRLTWFIGCGLYWGHGLYWERGRV